MVKYRIADKNGKSLDSFYAEDSHNILAQCRSRAFNLLANSKQLRVEYQRYNEMIQDWVSFGSLEGSL